MYLNEYQSEAVKTARDTSGSLENLKTLALGITGEAGEVADEIKKVAEGKRQLDKEVLVHEIMDCIWYCVTMLWALGWAFSLAAALNLKKLKHRHPNGYEDKQLPLPFSK